MSENIVPNTAAERLLTLLLLNEKVKEGCVIHKILEEKNTVIKIIHRVEGKRVEEHVSSLPISQQL
jgi:hypothetical protein